MDVYKCVVPSWHRGTLNSQRAANPLVRLVEGEESWETSDHSQSVFPLNWGGTEPNRTVTCMVLKATANDRRHLALCHDEFQGPRSGLCSSVALKLFLDSTETEACKKAYIRLPDAYGCLGILNLTLGDSAIQYLVLVNSCLSVGKILNSEIFRIIETNFLSLRNSPQDVERIQEVRKVLNSGTFYFSWSSQGKPLDLTLCEQRSHFAADSDNRFFWNKTMHISFIQNNICTGNWLLKVICGGIEIRTIYAGHLQARGCIISRLSSERAGTRFNVRGTNDRGCVANFVETEQGKCDVAQMQSFGHNDNVVSDGQV
ncbi:synaptojanin-1 [Trichonephila clavipes]|uniref:Phosphatidylinositol-3-phosphatase SAC1 n=1 Tax=Trichonephila clavipes TaxID=2585209 RepID=A0A8X6SF14_TRICX|nr:synaptojanin-1 [Trichonephila clavipes]